MRVLVEHDEQGNIQSVYVPGGPAGQEMVVTPEAGVRVTEVEATHISDANDHDRLRALATDFKMDADAQSLVKK